MLQIPSQIKSRDPLRRRMPAMEQAATPMNRKIDPKMICSIWPRSMARTWPSNRTPPKQRHDITFDPEIDPCGFILILGGLFGNAELIAARRAATVDAIGALRYG